MNIVNLSQGRLGRLISNGVKEILMGLVIALALCAVAIGGSYAQGIDEDTKLMLYCDGIDESTDFPDASDSLGALAAEMILVGGFVFGGVIGAAVGAIAGYFYWQKWRRQR